MSTPGAAVGDPGLQPERTSLAWSRTSLAVLLNSALLVAKDPAGMVTPTRAVLFMMTLLLAMLVFAVGKRRQQALRMSNTGAARAELRVVGICLVCVILAVSLALTL